MTTMLNNGLLCPQGEAVRYEDMTPLQKAKADMDFARRKGGFAYKQAKRHYERLQRKENRDGRRP